MPIDPEVAIGAELPDRDFSWTSSDVLLYHLGIGAGSRPGDNLDPAALRYTLDNDDLQVLPSFGVVAPTFHETDPPPLDLPGCDINLGQVVHGSQEIEVSGPLPTSGSATLHTRISEVWDKGKAAVIWQEGRAVSCKGEPLWSVRSSIFSPATCSGLIYGGVPSIWPASVVKLSEVMSGWRSLLPRSAFANPKSRIFTRSSGVTITFAGFRSRWTIPLLCAACRPSAICRA